VFTPVEHVRAYQRVVAQVEEAILTGVLPPGDRLPSERDLVVQFGVSRATVREALRVLESAGLISSRPGDPNGAMVLAMSTANLSRSMSIIARRERLELADLLQFRMFIESSVCELAACVRTDGQLVAIRHALDRMRASMDEGFDAFSQADLDFHLSIAAATDNPLLQACGEVILGLVRTMVRDKLAEAPDTRAQMAESLDRHELVLAAIEDGDTHRAAHLARIHQLEYYGAHLSPDVRVRLERLCREPS
jgi:GntR family transcriptional repressor for pyruvate dehydrogenase complex